MRLRPAPRPRGGTTDTGRCPSSSCTNGAPPPPPPGGRRRPPEPRRARSPDARSHTSSYPSSWTDGRAIVGTGSPFDPVTLADGRTLIPSQCNNMYVFPGIGLAASVAGVRRITDKMLYLAKKLVHLSILLEQDTVTEDYKYPSFYSPPPQITLPRT